MKTFVKCEMCESDISGEKCMFAIYKRTIGGKEHYFCCESHAKEFERKAKLAKDR